MSRSHVTIRDVAAYAGVSHQTVSRVMNGSERVSAATKARVEAAIAALGYQPSAIARSMASGRTGLLACLAPNLTDYTFASMIDGAEMAARQRGYFLLSASAQDEQTFAALVAQLIASRQVEGVMVIDPYVDGRFQHLLPDFPTVFAGARPHDTASNSVSLDDVQVGQTATAHLLRQGHRRIALVTGVLGENCAQDRKVGYEAALRAAGLQIEPDLIVAGNWQARSGYDALMHFAQSGSLPDAIFAQNDQMAVGVLRAARELGIKVPSQLAVIGVDDIPLAAYFEPPLTTLRQDFARIGQEAANLLIQAVEQPTGLHQHVQLSATLIVRQSTGAVAA
ncbi:MAG: LacI family DNA-binding transcriptional regulator [Anaerolineales bacterium]|nr:LacI family DNA-binding transcriptional regulator [Anaerolineales bacterium]